MGYLGNQLATLVTGVFTVALAIVWFWFLEWTPLLNFVFIMAIPITAFLTFTCWISQRSADYMHSHVPPHTAEEHSQESMQVVKITTQGNQVDLVEIKQVQSELSLELNNLKDSVKLKDDEIERLNQQIANLETRVQIESLKTELANLKMLSTKRKNSK